MVPAKNGVDTTLLFPMSRKIRKSPRLALVLFASSLIIATTAVINLYLFAKDCDADSKSNASSYALSGDPTVHRVIVPPQVNSAPVAPRQVDPVQPVVFRQPAPAQPAPAQPAPAQPAPAQPAPAQPAPAQPAPAQNAPAQPAAAQPVSHGSAQVEATADYVIDRVKGRISFPKPISRSVIGRVIEHMKLKKGVEVGVRQGVFSKEMLRQWPTCQSYHLVDLWGNPGGFLGGKYVDEKQAKNKLDALANTNPWMEKITLCHNFSTTCAIREPDSSFDFGYIDARHDFKSVLEDLEYWFPKIRVGGVMAGHDYMSAIEVRPEGINWGFNADGSKDYGMQAVKGAVNFFFAVHGQYVEPCSPIPSFSSWVVLKSAPGTNQPNDLLHFIDFSCFEERTCNPISDKFAQTVSDWEKINPRFLALVWTTETLSWYLQGDAGKYKSSYKNNAKAFEDMMKLKLIHKFGGTYIHESLSPSQSIQSHVDLVKQGSGPVAFCQGAALSGAGSFADNCDRVSRLLISGNKGDPMILDLAQKHEQEFMGSARSESETIEVTDRLLGAEKFRVPKSSVAFPCTSSATGCLAKLN